VTTCHDCMTSVAMLEDYDTELVHGVRGSGDCTLTFIWMVCCVIIQTSTYHK